MIISLLIIVVIKKFFIRITVRLAICLTRKRLIFSDAASEKEFGYAAIFKADFDKTAVS